MGCGASSVLQDLLEDHGASDDQVGLADGASMYVNDRGSRNVCLRTDGLSVQLIRGRSGTLLDRVL